MKPGNNFSLEGEQIQVLCFFVFLIAFCFFLFYFIILLRQLCQFTMAKTSSKDRWRTGKYLSLKCSQTVWVCDKSEVTLTNLNVKSYSKEDDFYFGLTVELKCLEQSWFCSIIYICLCILVSFSFEFTCGSLAVLVKSCTRASENEGSSNMKRCGNKIIKGSQRNVQMRDFYFMYPVTRLQPNVQAQISSKLS